MKALTHNIRFRRASKDEGPALTELALRSKAHWGYDEAFMSACREELTLTPEFFDQASIFVLEEEETGRPVGVSALESLEPEKPGEVELDLLFVEPDLIGTGLGRRLLEETMREAGSLGFQKMIIQGDPNAEAFYAAMGCVRVGERASTSFPGRMLPLFERPLGKEPS